MNIVSHTSYHPALSPIEEVIEDARNGRMFILVDAEERENEGDLVIPAQFRNMSMFRPASLGASMRARCVRWIGAGAG